MWFGAIQGKAQRKGGEKFSLNQRSFLCIFKLSLWHTLGTVHLCALCDEFFIILGTSLRFSPLLIPLSTLPILDNNVKPHLLGTWDISYLLRSVKEGKTLKVKRLSASSKTDLQTKASLCLGLNFQHPLKDEPMSSSDYLIPWTNQCQSRRFSQFHGDTAGILGTDFWSCDCIQDLPRRIGDLECLGSCPGFKMIELSLTDQPLYNSDLKLEVQSPILSISIFSLVCTADFCLFKCLVNM